MHSKRSHFVNGAAEKWSGVESGVSGNESVPMSLLKYRPLLRGA